LSHVEPLAQSEEKATDEALSQIAATVVNQEAQAQDAA
jgi:hypothetical protein